MIKALIIRVSHTDKFEQNIHCTSHLNSFLLSCSMVIFALINLSCRILLRLRKLLQWTWSLQRER